MTINHVFDRTRSVLARTTDEALRFRPRRQVSAIDRWRDRILPKFWGHSKPSFPKHDFQIDLGFDDAMKKLTFRGEDITVQSDGSFELGLGTKGTTRRVLFACDDPDGKLAIRGIRVGPRNGSAKTAPLHTLSGPIAKTPFRIEVTGHYLLLEDTYTGEEDLGEWPYCLAYQHGDLICEKDPEILNEGGSGHVNRQR